jgi:hypothetical protein
MSVKAAQQFFFEVAHNPLLQNQVDLADWDQVVQIAAREGYVFTPEELRYMLSKWYGGEQVTPSQSSHIRQ